MTQILLAGCGNMGQALLKAWLQDDSITQIQVIQPSLGAQSLFAPQAKIRFYKHASLLDPGFVPDVVVLAFKPKQLTEALKPLSSFFPHTPVVSLLAGTSIDKLRLSIGKDTPCTRIMPNVGVQTGQGASLAFSPKPERQMIEALFKCTGKLFWMPSENLLESLTTISGCGPAYFYLMAQIMTKMSVELGLEEETAKALVRQTLVGSASIASEHSELRHLISTVASKGGVTEAALLALEPGLLKSLEKAIKAGVTRLQEIQG